MPKNSHVVVLGTFDGIHKGHAAVLNAALGFRELIPVVVTFAEPPKRKVTGSFVPMLMTSEQKNAKLREMGFREIHVLDYDEIHDLAPEAFLDMLFEKYDIKAMVCGFNYRFGKDGAGDAAMLSTYCHEHGAEAVVVPAAVVSGQTVSSSLIRELISSGNISFANMLLGQPFCFKNTVIHGDERGRILGFPTVNIELDEQLVVPKFGVYASAVSVDGVYYPAVTNIGIRPTFLLKKPLSETHIVNFDGDLYGRKVTVSLLDFMREEKRFDGFDQLKSTIENDRQTAVKAFRSGLIPTEFVTEADKQKFNEHLS